VPFCGRSLKIGFVNARRGPGCFLHSESHGIESAGSRGGLPQLGAWFEPYAGFNLDRRYGLPFKSWYGLSCSAPPCLQYPAVDRVVSSHGGSELVTSGYDPVCGNVHFAPNANGHSDTSSPTPVSSSCRGFGRRQANGNDARALLTSEAWMGNEALAPDCGGAFLIFWLQQMPGFGTGQRFSDGGVMLPVWPFLYY
jgi:hypothetical protein